MFKPLSRWVAVCAFKEFGAFDGAIEIIFDNWTWYVGQKGWTVSLEKCLDQKFPFVEVTIEADGRIANDYFKQYETKGPKKLHSKELADWGTISRLGLSTQIGELRYAMAFQPKQSFEFNQTQKVFFEPSTGWMLLGYYSDYLDENVFNEEWLFNRGDDYIIAHQQEIQVDWETTTSWGLAALTRQQAADWLIENNITNTDDVVDQSSYQHLDQALGNAPLSVIPEGLSRSKRVVKPDAKLPKRYGAGEDGLRRDAKIYELAESGLTNGEIAKEIERLALSENWEAIGETHVPRRLTMYCLHTSKPTLDRTVGRPKSNSKT